MNSRRAAAARSATSGGRRNPGSDARAIAADQAPNRSRSSPGTPSSSAITVTGSGTASLHEVRGAGLDDQVDRLGGQLFDPRPQVLDHARSERLRHQTAQAGVVRRVEERERAHHPALRVDGLVRVAAVDDLRLGVPELDVFGWPDRKLARCAACGETYDSDERLKSMLFRDSLSVQTIHTWARSGRLVAVLGA